VVSRPAPVYYAHRAAFLAPCSTLHRTRALPITKRAPHEHPNARLLSASAWHLCRYYSSNFRDASEMWETGSTARGSRRATSAGTREAVKENIQKTVYYA
jgi:hypothetical protein